MLSVRGAVTWGSGVEDREEVLNRRLIDHDGLILPTSRYPFADFEFFDGGKARVLELLPLALGDGSAWLAVTGRLRAGDANWQELH